MIMKRLFVLSVTFFCIFIVNGQELTSSTLNSWERRFLTKFVKNEASTFNEAFSYPKKLDKIFAEMINMQNEGQHLGASKLGVEIYSIINERQLNFCKKNNEGFWSIYSNYEFYAWFLHKLSFSLNEQGLYSNALYYGLEAEKCWRTIKSSKKKNKAVDYLYAELTNNLAAFYYNSRDINEAKKWIKICIEQTKDKSGYESLYYKVLNTEACVLEYEGLYENALAIEETVVNNAPDVLPIWKLNYISFLYDCNKKDSAIKRMEEFLNEQKKKNWGNTIQFASYLNKLALFKQEKDINESIALTQEAINILKRQGNTLNSDYAQYLSNLALYYFDAGKKEDALKTEERAYNIYSNISAENLPQRLTSLFRLSLYQFENNQWKYAEENMIKGTKIQDDNIRYSMMQPQIIRQNLWKKCNGWYLTTIPKFAYHIKSDSLNMTAYNAALLAKGILLNTERSLQQMAEESPQLQKLYNDWQIAKSNYNSPHPAEQTEILFKSYQEAENIFLQNCRALKNATDRLSITWKDVQDRLGTNDVAIEFCSFKENEDTYQYFALIIKKGLANPVLIPLCEEKQIKRMASIVRDKDSSFSKYKSLSSLIWKPLIQYIQNSNNIYFSPSGVFHNIPIEILPHWNENILMSDRWHIYRLSSTRELVIASNSLPIKKAVVYGGINYNASIDMLASNNKTDTKYQIHNPHDFDSVFQSGFRNIDTKLLTNRNIPYNRDFVLNPSINITSKVLRDGFGDLPGTKVEAEEAYQLFKQTGIQATLYEGSQATEGTMKNLSGRKVNLLHIGTHGFYYQETEAKYYTHLAFLKQDNYQGQLTEDKALSNSGLLFSGANNAWKGNKTPAGFEDGILTAKEISQMDLIDLDLVVLAACESGLGEITGEGVYGLQRGFKKAGANSLLMSLWKVDDDATCLLISQFYKHLISGLSKSESLRQAQKYTQKKYPSPEHWAAFILLDAIK